jgi:hypothetical protein
VISGCFGFQLPPNVLLADCHSAACSNEHLHQHSSQRYDGESLNHFSSIAAADQG